MTMSIEKEISLLEKVVKNLWKPLIAGCVFPEEYIRNRELKESFDEICDEFFYLGRDKNKKGEEQFVIEKNALFDKLKKFFETYPKIAYIQKDACSRENLLWRPTWVKQWFRTKILEAIMWFEIIRLKELIDLKEKQLNEEEKILDIKDQSN